MICTGTHTTIQMHMIECVWLRKKKFGTNKWIIFKAYMKSRKIKKKRMKEKKLLTFFRFRERCRIQRTFYSTMPFVDVPWSSLCWLNDRLEWKYGTWSKIKKNILIAISFFELWIMIIICISLVVFVVVVGFHMNFGGFFSLCCMERCLVSKASAHKRVMDNAVTVQFSGERQREISLEHNNTSQNSLISKTISDVLRAWGR